MEYLRDSFRSGVRIFLQHPVASLSMSLSVVAAWLFAHSSPALSMILVSAVPHSIFITFAAVTIPLLSVFLLFYVQFYISKEALLLTEEGGRSGALPAVSLRRLVSYVAASLLFTVLISLGLIFFIVPGVVVTLGFLFFGFIIIDKGVDPIQSLKESWRLTRGKKMQLFVLLLLLAGFNVLGLLFFGIGVFITIPVSYFILANTYYTLKNGAYPNI